MHDKITSAIDNKKFSIGAFLDLSKAFDTVDHAVYFSKLEHYGFRGQTYDWLKSYFNNRSQTTMDIVLSFTTTMWSAPRFYLGTLALSNLYSPYNAPGIIYVFYSV